MSFGNLMRDTIKKGNRRDIESLRDFFIGNTNLLEWALQDNAGKAKALKFIDKMDGLPDSDGNLKNWEKENWFITAISSQCREKILDESSQSIENLLQLLLTFSSILCISLQGEKGKEFSIKYCEYMMGKKIEDEKALLLEYRERSTSLTKDIE